MPRCKVALAPFLRACPEVVTLGLRATIDDYSAAEKSLLRAAERVFFPTHHFAYLFNALRIPTFPSHHTHRLQRSRVLQEILMACTGIPHPLTRIYFGERQKATIARTFSFPMIAMGPLTCQRQKHLVDNCHTLDASCRAFNPVIIQEAVPWDTCVRVLWIGTDCVGVVRKDGVQGPDAAYQPIPLDDPRLGTVLEMTRAFAYQADLDDLVMEWGCAGSQWLLIEMSRPPLRWPLPLAIMHRHHYLCDLVSAGRL